MSSARRDDRTEREKMDNVRISRKFMDLSDLDLVAFTENIAARLTANANFPEPVVSIDGLLALSSKFSDAIAGAEFGDRQAIAERNIIRTLLFGELLQLVTYVQITALDDVAMMLTSGFEPREPLDLPAPPAECKG